MSKKTQTKKYAVGANKKVMKYKKVVITVSENGELQMDLIGIRYAHNVYFIEFF